jgi:hypothetical protein
MSPRGNRERTRELRDELDANILPRQRRALELLADRLSDERPLPGPALWERLDDLMRELPARTGVPRPASWRLWAALSLASGLALLVVVALLVAAGEPGGH